MTAKPHLELINGDESNSGLNPALLAERKIGAENFRWVELQPGFHPRSDKTFIEVKVPIRVQQRVVFKYRYPSLMADLEWVPSDYLWETARELSSKELSEVVTSESQLALAPKGFWRRLWCRIFGPKLPRARMISG